MDLVPQGYRFDWEDRRKDKRDHVLKSSEGQPGQKLFRLGAAPATEPVSGGCGLDVWFLNVPVTGPSWFQHEHRVHYGGDLSMGLFSEKLRSI